MTTHTLTSAQPAVLPNCPASQVLADLKEEKLNTLTHGIGAVISLAGFAVLLGLALRTGQTMHLAGSLVYGVTLVLLYCASTIYHGVQTQPLKAILRIADHIGIYLMVAGTFTPFALASAPRHGFGPLAAGWALTLAAIGIKILRAKRESLVVSTAIYVVTIAVIGWLGLDTLLSTPRLGVWLIVGAMFYGQGLWFFMQSRRFYHSIWHLFVIAGSACHYGAVVLLVLK